ncbi:MAG: hypothetical protein OXF41_07625 [bacterium]|nr:hypothetical protein [bacterium]
MGDDRPGEAPGARAEELTETPDLVAVLTEAVRAAALRLPRERPLPVVYVVDPFPEDAAR